METPSSVLQRVLQFPVVNSALTSLQRTYASAKEIHPVMASVCATYERALQNVSSLALWSVKPVVHKLEPQLAAANVLACQGLDHLEKKMPILQKPVEEATSDLKDTILTHLHYAICSVVDILDKVFGLSAENNEQSKNSLKIKTENAKSSQVNQVAKTSAIGKLEKVVDWKMEPNSVHKPADGCVSEKMPPSSTFASIKSLAAAVSQLAFKQASQAIQVTKDKGVKLATWISYLFTFPRVLMKEEETMAMGPPESYQEQDGVRLLTPESKKLQERRSSRGHYPLPFLNLDEPPPLEAESTVGRKSAFSPYKEGSSNRRWSEGLFRSSLETTHMRAHFARLYSSAVKKD
ncbi:perilipin-1 isoform X2 [Ahaetulla prasina]|uniref:perilipin-1 isoform X2 n=1 Tax=Ahaetulla prasina TaxID=499056 RepID=UPI002647381D|nr:perilipin-1 isoform X2 [Ahaetulla prasina]XP_058012364.1 perilipin-1 isoform X2 [Ahaetulla prasina]